jgi:hypothetical protein
MKATLDIPDPLYRRVKAKSALAGRPVREVAIRLFSEWVDESEEMDQVSKQSAAEIPPWFGIAKPYAAHVDKHDMVSVRESIAEGRYKA